MKHFIDLIVRMTEQLVNVSKLALDDKTFPMSVKIFVLGQLMAFFMGQICLLVIFLIFSLAGWIS